MKKITRTVVSLRKQGVSREVCAEILAQQKDSAALLEWVDYELSVLSEQLDPKKPFEIVDDGNP